MPYLPVFHAGILFSLFKKKEGNSTLSYNMDEPGGHHASGISHKKTNTV